MGLNAAMLPMPGGRYRNELRGLKSYTPVAILQSTPGPLSRHYLHSLFMTAGRHESFKRLVRHIDTQ